MSRLRKTASIKEQYNEEYQNKHGQVTPYHILFKDYGDDIASSDFKQAKQICFNKIEELNSQYYNDPDYYEVTDEDKVALQRRFDNEEADSGMDVLFIIKDFLLESEGLEKQSSRLRKNRG